MKSILSKKALTLFLTVALVITATIPLVITGTARAADSDRYITITLHAGSNGYFGDPSVTEIDSVQFRGDSFEEETVPDAIDPEIFFLGWATTEDATEPDIANGGTYVNSIGTDAYAVWSDKLYVVYNCTFGYYDNHGMQYNEVIMEYPYGDTFKSFTPIPITDQFIFDDWYTGLDGTGTKLTEDYVLDVLETRVYANWLPNPDNIEPMVIGEEYPIEVYGPGVLYSFTPDETAIYEFYSTDIVGNESQASIKILDGELRSISQSIPRDYEGNCAANYELIAGTTYYIQLQEEAAHYAEYTAQVHIAESVNICFHANRADGKAYFNDDPETAYIDVHIKAGTELSTYSSYTVNLTIPPESKLMFAGWSLEMQAEDPDESIIATVNEDKFWPDSADMDLFAVYYEYEELTMDANGGYFPMNDGAEVTTYQYFPWTPFETKFDPKTNDHTKKFAGWASTPDATEPEIEEGTALITEIVEKYGDTLYAVYTDKVLVTFDAVAEMGGYMMDEPDITTYQSTYGNGHIFYGMALMNDDPRMTPLAWVDDKGTEIPFTSESDPSYHIDGDTVFTALWGRKVTVYANGGYFDVGGAPTGVNITFEAAEMFNTETIEALVGNPIPDDTSKCIIGWATDPDATEPDIIPGETPIMDLDYVFAVWGDDSYYIVEGEDGEWEKGSSDGYQIIVKREGEDRLTFSDFVSIAVDDSELPSAYYTKEEGSLILTLKPAYLETLSTGLHSITINFESAVVETTLTIKEAAESEETESSDESEETESSEETKESEETKASEETEETASSDETESSEESKTTKASDETKESESQTTKPDSSSSSTETTTRSNSGTTTPTNNGKNPKTGDDNNLLLWNLMLIGSLAGLTGITIYFASRKKKNDQ